jgi:hypothetical protein
VPPGAPNIAAIVTSASIGASIARWKAAWKSSCSRRGGEGVRVLGAVNVGDGQFAAEGRHLGRRHRSPTPAVDPAVERSAAVAAEHDQAAAGTDTDGSAAASSPWAPGGVLAVDPR